MPTVKSVPQTTSDTGITEAQVYEAIADVLDPELDKPLVELGFIDSVRVEGQDVTVTFRLPTFWCAPNFAYLMAADLRRSIRAIPGVQMARVVLLDHCAEDEITSGVNAEQSFATAFSDASPDDENLEELRLIFLRKGFLMRQDTLLRYLLKAGLDESLILTLKRGDVLVDEATDAIFITLPQRVMRVDGVGRNMHLYLNKGVTLSLPHQGDDLLFTDDEGHAISPGGLRDYLRRSRAVRLNITFNTSFCTSLFQTRYQARRDNDISH